MIRRIAGRLKAPFVYIRRKIFTNGIVLLYHRVYSSECDPQLLCVSPENFEKHMDFLRENTVPVSLCKMVENIDLKQITKNTVAVTFDDGYSDNLLFAKPVLRKYEIPATVFVSSGCIGDKYGFWWDILANIFLKPCELPERFSSVIKDINFSLGSASAYRKPVCDMYTDWNVLSGTVPTLRHAVYLKLCRELRALSPEKRDGIIIELISWANLEINSESSSLPMNEKELLALTDGSLIDIGGHTFKHERLSSIDPEKQEETIRKDRDNLERILGRKPDHFSYPFGARHDYTKITADIAGKFYKSACANFPDTVYSGTSKYQIPRLIVRNLGIDEFRNFIYLWS